MILIPDKCHEENISHQDTSSSEIDESKLPLQLAIVGRPNVGKSTLLNALLEEDRVMVGPEAGLTRDSVRVQFKYQERTVYLVGTCSQIIFSYSFGNIIERGVLFFCLNNNREFILKDTDEINCFGKFVI